MKKRLQIIKDAKEYFSARPTKQDKSSEELIAADQRIEKFKEVLDRISRKFLINPSSSGNTNGGNGDQHDIEKRCKKVHEYKLAQAMEESVSYLGDGMLRDVLMNCAKLERDIATEIITNESNVESNVTKYLAMLLENNVATIQKHKRVVHKLQQDNESAKHKHQAALASNENPAKIDQLRDVQMECEKKLEKERDIWAAEMFELIADEENVASYVMSYISHQKAFYRSALNKIELATKEIDDFMRNKTKRIFKVKLQDHLAMNKRPISYAIELCVCCLLEKGLYEEGLLRVACAGTKLRRLRSAIDANIITLPYPSEYQDAHTIACVLKSYLRDLPDPLLTYELFDQFIAAAQRPSEDQRKMAILNVINQLPSSNYDNLKYLSKFLEILSQKSAINKMTPQNIAIVMSPNLFWSSRSNDIEAHVSSNASGSKIVETLITDWSYFFGNDFTIDDFYVTMTRDELFPLNSGLPVDQDPFSYSPKISVPETPPNSIGHSYASLRASASNLDEPSFNPGHSRSSSHDTSQILMDSSTFIGGSTDSLTKRSQSSLSLSDSSPPPINSPKPIRRNKKTAAPHPPTEPPLFNQSTAESLQTMKENFFNSTPCTPNNEPKFNTQRLLQSETKASTALFKEPSNTISMKRISGSTENLISKPNKPPRPVLPNMETLTLTRSSSKGKSDRHTRPIALPRSLLNVAQSTENLCTASKSLDECDTILLRDHSADGTRTGKPAIPERPVTLIKPNLRAAAFDKFDNNAHEAQSSGIKKTQSFRTSTASVTTNGSASGRSATTLERTHIYNVDKKQVEIIDVDQSSSGNSSIDSPSHGDVVNGDVSNGKSDRFDKPNEVSVDGNGKRLRSSSTSNVMSASCSEAVPQSPRCVAIKRPQIPAPPPPGAGLPPPNPRLSPNPIDAASELNHNEQSNTPKKLDANASAVAGDSTKL